MTQGFNMILAAVLTLGAASALAQDAIGVVKRAHGPAVIDRAGVRLPATRGTQLRKGDRIVTGANGYVDVTMRGSAVSVGPRANVGLDGYAPAESQTAQSSVPPILQGLASLLSVNRGR